MRVVRRLSVAIVALVAASTGLVACSSAEDEATEALVAFLSGWSSGDLSAVTFTTPVGETVSDVQVAEQLAALSGDLAERPPALTAGQLTLEANLATAPVAVEWPLPGGGTWRYSTEVRLSERDGQWRVIWSSELVHPDLTSGDTLAVRRIPTTRGDIVDRHGEALVTLREVRHLGIHPARLTNPETTLAELSAALATIDVDIPAADLVARASEADPEHFVPVVTLRRSDYDQIADRLAPLAGVIVREDEQHLAPSRVFALALLGRVGEATAEDLERHPDRYVAGDQVGHGGLAERYDEQLRGTPGRTVVISRPAADGEVTEVELWREDPVPGSDLTITLDRKVQEAAEAALAQSTGDSALVAIKISDSTVVAAANMSGAAANPVNLAFTARVPPGSTFKMVSAYALLEAGVVELDTPVPCPAQFTVDGRTIGNAGGFGLGDVPFRTAVARSCNTTFAALAPQLPADGLATAGAKLGLGGDWDLGVETFSGAVSTGGSATEQAAAAFGQGTTVVSPVAMAAATAAVARGAWAPPRLLLDPAPPTAEPVPLDASTVEDLHAALRQVVTSGTAQALAGVPGGDVFGKTGSAEYEDGSDATHAWFVGWQGDLAFAVFVADGGSGSEAAVPIARDFLTRLAG